MADLTSVAELSALKHIPVEVLTGYGLRDIPGGGVHIDYLTPDGHPGRARHRWQVTGLTGSTFEESDRPVTAYWRPESREFARRRDTVLLTEGESTCWTLWYRGFAAAGFPGAEQVDCLDAGHWAPASTAVIVAEWDDPDTYPDGVGDFVDRVVRRLAARGFDGVVKVLDLEPVAEDINALYRADPERFETALLELISKAPKR